MQWVGESCFHGDGKGKPPDCKLLRAGLCLLHKERNEKMEAERWRGTGRESDTKTCTTDSKTETQKDAQIGETE